MCQNIFSTLGSHIESSTVSLSGDEEGAYSHLSDERWGDPRAIIKKNLIHLLIYFYWPVKSERLSRFRKHLSSYDGIRGEKSSWPVCWPAHRPEHTGDTERH